jgi:P27 family predicted phage terminase small subunit
MLERYKLVTDIDTAALALYCQSYGRWQQAENKLNKLRDAGLDALIIESPNGYQIRNPWFDIANRCMEDCYKYLQQFGLSPAARTRVEPGKPIQGNLFPDEPGQEYFT